MQSKILKIKIVLIFVICSIFSKCSTNRSEKIIENLKKNYTQCEPNQKNDFIEYLKINNSKFEKDSLIYLKTRRQFQNSNIKMIFYLLSFENDTFKFSNLISTSNPYDSKDFGDINNSKSALILLDNFLLNSNEKIVIPKYIDKLKFNEIKEKILVKKSLKKTRENYLKYVSQWK